MKNEIINSKNPLFLSESGKMGDFEKRKEKYVY